MLEQLSLSCALDPNWATPREKRESMLKFLTINARLIESKVSSSAQNKMIYIVLLVLASGYASAQACAARYTVVSLYVCVDCYSCSIINEVQVRACIGF